MMQMFGHSVRRTVLILGAIEAAMVYAAIFLIATLVVHSPDGPSGLTAAATLPALLIIAFMLALGVYEPDARADLPTMTERLSVACVAGAGIGFGIVYLMGDIWVSPLYAVACASFSYAAVAAARFVFSRILRAEPFQRRILIIGDGEAANELISITTRTGCDAHVTGVMKTSEAADRGKLLKRALALDVAEIVVADRHAPLPHAGLLDCKAEGIRIFDSLDFGENETGMVDLDHLYPARFIFSRTAGYSRLSMNAKRAMDILVSGIALLMLSPILAIAALAIKLDSKGPVLYSQTRVGLMGAPYEIFKFRSMRTDAEADGVAVWAGENDPRITKVGKFLRATRIDELPQIWNILKGEMSLVGPRPERPFFVTQLAESLPFYNERHRVKPGLTGWAQINYRYGASQDDSRMKLRYDLHYAKNFSVFLDIIILMKTIRVVLWPDGVR
jgi:sugar transferase (PEP-CTERM system associated)